MKVQKPILFYGKLYQHFVDQLLVKYPNAICNTDPANRVKRGIIYIPDKEADVKKVTIGYEQKMIRCRELITYKRWRIMIDEYCYQARQHIIQGNTFVVGRGVGKIQVMMIEKVSNRKYINYRETAKVPKIEKDGKLIPEYIVYYTDDFFPKIVFKRACKLRNERSYRFVPAKGNGPGKGFKQELDREITLNPLLITKYQVKKSRNVSSIDI